MTYLNLLIYKKMKNKELIKGCKVNLVNINNFTKIK